MEERALNILYTVLYTALLAWMLYRHQRSIEGRWGIGSYILLSYVLYPIIGAFWFFDQDNIYGDIEPLKLFPFIYLAVLQWIAVRPILQYDRNHIQQIEQPSMSFLNIFAAIYIVCTLLQIPHIIANIADGIRNIMVDTAAGADMYLESQAEDSSYDGSVGNLTAIIFNIFSPLAFILFFYYMTLGRKYLWAIIGFGLCVLIKSFHSLSNGQRTEVTMSVINIFVAYVALKPILSDRIKRYVRIVLTVLAVSITIPFIALTISRFGERQGGTTGGLVYYIGEAPYYFNNYALDAGGTRHGDRTCNVFKKLIGKPSPNGIFDVREAYPMLKMDDSIFSTFIGDFVLDFGATTTAIIFILFSILFTRLTPTNGPNQIPFHRLILIYFAMSVCMQGGFYLFNYAFEGNLQILAIFVFYVFFGLDYLMRHRKERRLAL
jgi:oligosaccharide repeat unit polymerase